MDPGFVRRVNGFDRLEDFYADISSLHYLSGIDTPMVFVNARDDPIVPPAVLDEVRQFCREYRLPDLLNPGLITEQDSSQTHWRILPTFDRMGLCSVLSCPLFLFAGA